jgi:hypothetical protein
MVLPKHHWVQLSAFLWLRLAHPPIWIYAYADFGHLLFIQYQPEIAGNEGL